MNEELADRYWDIRLGARTRALYYGRRILFWSGLKMFSQFGAFILSTAAFLALTRDHATFGTWTTFAVSILSFLVLLLGAGKRARMCEGLSREYGMIVADVPPYHNAQTSEKAEKAKAKLDELYAKEGAFLDCLAVACYRDACFEFGAEPQCRLSWFERTVGRFLPIPYTPKKA